MRQLFIFIFLLCSLSAFSQNNIKKTAGVNYTQGAPTFTPNESTASEIAIDTVTGFVYQWHRTAGPTNFGGWRVLGQGIDVRVDAVPPTYTPFRNQSVFVVNAVDSLYYYHGGSWHHINKGGGGGSTYTAGAGIAINGSNVISNTGDLSTTNELQNLSLSGQSLGISSGTGVTLPIVGVSAGTGISVSTAGGVATVSATGGGGSLPSQEVGFGNGSSIVSDTTLKFNSTTDILRVSSPSNKGYTEIGKSIEINPDTLLTSQNFMKILGGKSSPYTYAPFGLSVAYDNPSQTPYKDYVWTFGPNAAGNSGVSYESTKPMASINWETSWIDGGVPTYEWHETWKQPDSSAIRLKSYTIRYANAISPTTKTSIDLYQTADTYTLKSSENYKGNPAIFTVSKNKTTGLSVMTMQAHPTGAFSFGGSKTGSQNIFYVQAAGTTGTNQFDLSGWDILSYSGAGDLYTKSTRTLDVNILHGITKLYSPNLDFVTAAGTITFGGARGFGVGATTQNVYLGYAAGPVGYGGDFNVAICHRAMANSGTAAYRNVAVGEGTLQNVGNAVGCVAIGAYAANSINGASTKCVVIGDSAAASINSTNLNNKLWIDASANTTPLFSGDFSTNRIGINVASAAPVAALQVVGTGTTSATYPLIVTNNSASTSTAALAVRDDGNIGMGTNAPGDRLTVAGNVSLSTAGNKIKVATGTNASAGTATLVGGTVTVNTTAVTSNSLIFVKTKTVIVAQGTLSTPAANIVNGVSFKINSSNVADASTVDWWIIN